MIDSYRVARNFKFAGSNFCDFFSDPQKKVPANKNYRKHISRKNLLHSKYTRTLIRYTNIQHYEIASAQLQFASFIQKSNGIQLTTGFIWGTLTVILCENMYFYCTYLTKTKMLSKLGTGYFLKTEKKINFQLEEPICLNRKN